MSAEMYLAVAGAVALAFFGCVSWLTYRDYKRSLEQLRKAQRDAVASVKVSGPISPPERRIPVAAPVYAVTEKPKRKPRSDKGKRRKKKPGRKEVDIQGHRFGLLVAVRRDGTMYKSKAPAWIFRCDCGNVIRAAKAGIAFPSSEQVSCGCWKRETSAHNAAKASAAAAAKRKEMH